LKLNVVIFFTCLFFWSCNNDDEGTEPVPVNNEPYLVEIDTFSMLGFAINGTYPCNNFVVLRNFGQLFDDYRINSFPSNFDPNNNKVFYTGVFRIFPDSTFECRLDNLDPPPTKKYINIDLLYFQEL
jgi:hypothetical protein